MRLTPSRIKRYRKRVGITQQQLADRCLVTQVTVARWESGFYPPTGAGGKLLTRLLEEAKGGTDGERKVNTA